MTRRFPKKAAEHNDLKVLKVLKVVKVHKVLKVFKVAVGRVGLFLMAWCCLMGLAACEGGDYVLHLKLHMSVVSYYGPAILCPCHRSHEALASKRGKGNAGVPACGKENCDPSVVSDINQICMARALYVMAFPAGM